jgi:uncharacterized Zn finger protein (UPF0148 family)
MLCPNCKKPTAKHPIYGTVICDECRERHHPKPSQQVEFTSDNIREQRKEFSDDIEQPHRKGQLNKKWVEIHGEEVAKRQGYTDTEIKNAKYVYSDDTYYDNNK